jgi:hypothetical protein
VTVYEILKHRELDSPLLVLATEGWVDAGLGASGATAHLLAQLDTEVMVRFDADEFIDFRARRPLVRIVDGVNMGLQWPQLALRVGRDTAGHDVLLLVGPEPDMKWHLFVRTHVGMTVDLGVRLVCGLGAFPAPVPHTRPERLAATATTKELADRVGHVNGTIEVATGVHGALEGGFGSAGVPAVGLWARVPHYLTATPYPAASAALLDGLATIGGISLDSAELHEAAADTGRRVDEMIANSADHVEMVRQLETAVDATEPLPSGDEIAAELERFLRDQGRPPGEY